MAYFYELFEALPRGGPGDNQSTLRAFKSIPEPPEKPLILDIGCGPGVQTIELAICTDGKIMAIDNHQPFLDTLIKNATDNGVIDHIVAKNMSMLDMDFEKNEFAIIWSEGALYFMGFQNGLRTCRQLLKKGGFLAVTEIVYLVNSPPDRLIQYFQQEYPDIGPVQDKIELIQTENFRLISHFTLPKSSWVDSFYRPMEAELARLKKKYRGNDMAIGIFEEMKNEIHLYEQFSDFYGYEFFIMQRID